MLDNCKKHDYRQRHDYMGKGILHELFCTICKKVVATTFKIPDEAQDESQEGVTEHVFELKSNVRK